MPGKIITFYSYKGGVGRSMMLANVAWILASNGKTVLVIDWHIDAPGLHRYFAPFLIDPQLTESRGIMDFVSDYALDITSTSLSPHNEPTVDILHYAVSVDWSFPDNGGIDLVPAGRSGPSYSVAVSSFDWVHFYERLGGASFLKTVRKEIRDEYDYVLIDSQPGISQVSAICTVDMPDTLVVCCGLNRQNMLGAAAVARSVQQQRQSDPCLIYPLLMRVDWSEKEMLDNTRQEAAREFEPLMGHIRDRSRYWSNMEIPYTPYYSYVEVLAPFVDSDRGKFSMLTSAEQLTSYITDGEVTRTELLNEVERELGLEAFLNDAHVETVTAKALLDMGDYYFRIEEFDQAVKLLSRAIDLQPNNPDAYDRRAAAYWYVGQHKQAIEDYTRELELEPNSIGALNGRGQCYAESSKYSKAVDDLLRVVEQGYAESSIVAYSLNGLGLAYAGLGRFDDSLETFNRSLKIAPNNAWAYFNRALAYEMMKQPRKALEDYRRSLEKQSPRLNPWKREQAIKRLSRPLSSTLK